MPALLARSLHAGPYQVPMHALLLCVFVPDRFSCQGARRWLGTSNPGTFLFGRPHVHRHNRRRGGGTEDRGKRWAIFRSQYLTPIRHEQATVQTFLNFNTGTGVAGMVEVWIQLQGAPVILDSVVLRHAPQLLDAEHRPNIVPCIKGTIGTTGLRRWDTEALIETGQELSQDTVSFR
jgi:hypothetical protein